MAPRRTAPGLCAVGERARVPTEKNARRIVARAGGASLASSPLVDIAGATEMSKPTSSPREGVRRSTPDPFAGGRFFGAGLTLELSVGLFAYGGLWLDRQLGTRPWMLLLLVACGIVGGMLHVIRVFAPDMWPFDKPAPKTPDRPRRGPPPSG